MEKHWTHLIPSVLRLFSVILMLSGLVIVTCCGKGAWRGLSSEWLLGSGFVLLFAVVYFGSAVKATYWFECRGDKTVCILMLQSRCAKTIDVIVDVWFQEHVRVQILTAQESRMSICPSWCFSKYQNLQATLRPFTEGKIEFEPFGNKSEIDSCIGRGIKIISGYGVVKVKKVRSE